MKPSPFIMLCGTGLFAIFSSTISNTGPIVSGFAANYFGFAWAFMGAAIVLVASSILFWTGVMRQNQRLIL